MYTRSEVESLRKVEGYQCTECEEIIKEVKVSINYTFNMDVEDYFENGELEFNEIRHMFENELTVICPYCGSALQ